MSKSQKLDTTKLNPLTANTNEDAAESGLLNADTRSTAAAITVQHTSAWDQYKLIHICECNTQKASSNNNNSKSRWPGEPTGLSLAAQNFINQHTVPVSDLPADFVDHAAFERVLQHAKEENVK